MYLLCLHWLELQTVSQGALPRRRSVPECGVGGFNGFNISGGAGTTFELGVDAQRRERSLQGGTDHGALAQASLNCRRARLPAVRDRMCPESCRKASWRKAPADWLTTLPRYAA